MRASEAGRARRAGFWPRVLPVIAVFLMAGAVKAHFGRAAPTAERRVIDVRDFEFQPRTLRVAVGDTVVWSNGDAVVHTATAADWDTRDIAGGSTVSIVMKRRGISEYVCEYHPSMKGRLEVR